MTIKNLRNIGLAALTVATLGACYEAGPEPTTPAKAAASGDLATGEMVIGVDLRSAPVVSNGLVGGAPAEYNIVLRRPGVAANRALDRHVRGLDIPPGGRLEVEHIEGFTRVSPKIVANANIILTTGPQNPIVATSGAGPQHGNWAVEDDGAAIVSIVPRDPSGLTGARAKKLGLKVIHLRPNPRSGKGPAIYTNAAAGSKLVVEVRLRDRDGRVVARGRGQATAAPATRPAIHVTNQVLQSRGQAKPDSTDVALIESVDFQRVSPGARLDNVTRTGTNHAPMFLVFAAATEQPDSFIPQRGMAGVGVRVDATDPSAGTLVRDSNGDGTLSSDEPVVGSIRITGPGGSGPRLLARAALTTSGDGVSGPNGSLLITPVQVGSVAGDYTVQVSLSGGGSATVTIVAR